LFLQVLLVVLKLASLDGFDTVYAKINHFAQTAYLAGQIDDVKCSTLYCLFEQLVKGHAHNFFKLSKPLFNVNGDLHWLHKRHILALAADH